MSSCPGFDVPGFVVPGFDMELSCYHYLAGNCQCIYALFSCLHVD